MYHPLTAVAEN